MPTDGNSRIIAVAKQTAKGTPNTTPTEVFPLNGDGGLNPNREIIQLPETDASAQRADSVVVGSSPGGTWSGWLRAKQFKMIAEGIMGATAGSPTATATPTKVLPYYTCFDIIPGVRCTQYNDVRFTGVTVSSQSMQGAQYSLEAVGLSAVLNAAEPAFTMPTDLKYAHTYLTVTVGGSAPGTHDSIQLTIARNVSLLRGDQGLNIFDSHPGLFDVSGQFTRIFTNDDDYAKVHGGSAGATTLTRTIFSESLSVLYAEDATHSIEFVSTGIEYTDITEPVNVDGAPIINTLVFNTKRQATWANNLTIITKHP